MSLRWTLSGAMSVDEASTPSDISDASSDKALHRAPPIANSRQVSPMFSSTKPFTTRPKSAREKTKWSSEDNVQLQHATLINSRQVSLPYNRNEMLQSAKANERGAMAQTVRFSGHKKPELVRFRHVQQRNKLEKIRPAVRVDNFAALSNGKQAALRFNNRIAMRVHNRAATHIDNRAAMTMDDRSMSQIDDHSGYAETTSTDKTDIALKEVISSESNQRCPPFCKPTYIRMRAGLDWSHVDWVSYLGNKDWCEIGVAVYKVGVGMYHSSVVVDRIEWHFWEGHGVEARPRYYDDEECAFISIDHLPLQTIISPHPLKVPPLHVARICRELGSTKFSKHTYDIIRCNCNHFTLEVLIRLGLGDKMPNWVNRLAGAADQVCLRLPFVRNWIDNILNRRSIINRDAPDDESDDHNSPTQEINFRRDLHPMTHRVPCTNIVMAYQFPV